MGRDEDILSCYKYIYKVTPKFKYREIDDIRQNAWLEVIKLHQRYDGRVKFFTLAKSRITGSVIDYIRKETHEGNVNYIKLKDIYSYNYTYNHDLSILLKDIILTNKEKLWLKLYLTNLLSSEIAKKMKVTEGRITHIKNSVIKKLKEKYENHSITNSI